MAASSIEDCFYSVIAARKLAETYRMPVVVLTDANLATAQQPFVRPKFQKEWAAPPVDQSPVAKGERPYEWDAKTGLADRFIPGRADGMHTLTGLAHDRMSRVAYDAEINQEGIKQRSLKLATLQKALKTPKVNGDEDGQMLVVGWGSTKGAIEEAVERLRADGSKVSSLHLKFLQPMASGIKEILQRFDKVMTVEISWCDDLDDEMIDEEQPSLLEPGLAVESEISGGRGLLVRGEGATHQAGLDREGHSSEIELRERARGMAS